MDTIGHINHKVRRQTENYQILTLQPKKIHRRAGRPASQSNVRPSISTWTTSPGDGGGRIFMGRGGNFKGLYEKNMRYIIIRQAVDRHNKK
jgi:hypothetical protein